jgi:pSer/pThr/pTyr-binding forkhead associated (FHA) protein
MDGAFIEAAKKAAASFISGLKSNDQVAILTFDDQVKIRMDFNTDQSIIAAELETITAKSGSGTCLFDAAYTAVEMFSKNSSGNRAVILFTDGRDETPTGARCSKNNVESVINLASRGELRTPIFTVGLGLDKDVATDILKNFADQTGGYYGNSPYSGDLTKAFDNFSAQLRAQYILAYRSTAAPGEHKLAVTLQTPGPDAATPQDTDSRMFLLPALAPHISFIAPAEGETIREQLKVAVAVTSQGQALIERVAFEVNGAEVDSDPTTPYELEFDVRQYPPGEMKVAAVVYGQNDTELARNSLNLVHVQVFEVTIPAPTLEPTPVLVTPDPTATNGTNPVVWMSILLSGLSIASIGMLLFMLVRQQNRAKGRELENFIDEDRTAPALRSIPVYRKIEEPRRASSSEPESDVLGALTIEASDDTSLIGHRFEIIKPLVTLGRSADNDLNFPSDKPVSRHHAEIYQISGKLYLREVEMADASGTAKPPKYGTFLNQKPMGSDPAQLKSGDEIQLGKRVRLKFESYARDLEADALTYDEEDDLTAADDIDKTSVQD